MMKLALQRQPDGQIFIVEATTGELIEGVISWSIDQTMDGPGIMRIDVAAPEIRFNPPPDLPKFIGQKHGTSKSP